MKAILEDLSIDAHSRAFRAYRYSVTNFEFKWHYHPEFELTLITDGVGDRIVGDSFEEFRTGDLVLLGSELPHTWVNKKEPDKYSSAVVIQFSNQFVRRVVDLNEFRTVRDLLKKSAQGLHFPQPSEEILHKILKISETDGVQRITLFFEILDMLSKLSYRALASPFFQPIKNQENELRINVVCEYILKNSSTDISLKSVAELIHLSESAFCKFFKKMTGKTYSDYLNEIRIGKACTLLTSSDKTIAEIGFQTGFESITYFNRIFLRKKKRTPSEFRKMSRNNYDKSA